jgi:hypothetical protein
MDKHFMAVIAAGAIALGALGIICGTALIIVMKDPMAGAVCLGIGATALGTLGGVLVAPKVPGATATFTTSAPPDTAPEADSKN